MARGKHTIVEEIRLTGAPEIEAEFAKLGAAGVKAFAELKKAADDVASAAPLMNFINKQIKDFQRLGAEAKKVGQTYKELGTATVQFGRNLALIAGAVTGAGAAFVALVKSSADAADAQNKAAQAAGLSQEQYGKLQFAFEQGNVGAEAFGVAMKKLNTNIDQASHGVGVGAKLFEQLGINVRDAEGNLRPTDEIIQAIAAKFQKLPDGPAKSALAIKLFGKAGADIIPVMNDGAEAMQKLEDQAVKLGLVFTAAEAKVGDDFGDALNESTKAVTALSQHLALLFAPSLTETFRAFTQVLADNREQIMAFGQTIADQVAPILQDFIKLLQGKDSEVQNKNLLAIRDTIVSIGQAMEIVASIVTTAFAVLEDAIRPFVELFNEAFGTHFTAQAALISTLIFAMTGGFKVLGLGIKAVSGTVALLVSFIKTGAGLIQIALLGIVAAIGVIKNAVDDVGTAFGAIPGVVAAVGNAILQVVQAIASAIVAVWTAMTKDSTKLFTDLGNALAEVFTKTFDAISEGIAALFAPLKDLFDLATKTVAAIASALSGGGGNTPASPEGHKAGGHIRGPGTGTSDSILARLSTGEFVVRAKAVSKYGVGLLNALNSMRLPRLGFADGGLVGALNVAMPSLPAFAAGGPVGRPLSLTIGGETFAGLIAPDTVADKLVRYANGRAVRSAGRRPSWSH